LPLAISCRTWRQSTIAVPKVHAAMVRAYLRAAFAYGLQSEHSYTQAGGARWGLTSNPVIAIPVGEGISNPRNRFLTPAEVRTLWNWLES
jgi:hypothetical protein